MPRKFYPFASYSDGQDSYRLLPFKFLRLSEEREVLVNEVGEFVLAPAGTAAQLVQRTLERGSNLYATFKAKQFIADNSSSPLLDVLATKYRTKYSFIDGFTKLHIFVVTLRCDHSCHYCQVSRQTTDRAAYDMSEETAARSIELMVESPAPHITLELQGGEPLLAFDRIRYIVPAAKQGAARTGKTLDIVVTTNLANVTDEMLTYFREEHVKISTSLDGPEFIHNANRPRPGQNSYQLTIENIEKARSVLGVENVSALMTTTQLSLQHPKEIIDEYVRQGFHAIFLRPISPYGFAVRSKEKTGYELEAFLNFYRTGLDYILQLNKSGYSLAEVYAKILLTKILTPYGTGYVDLQSPAGAGVNVLVYNYDGDVYASDESRMLAEMKDFTFRLGNVRTHTRKQLLTGERFLNIAAVSCNQGLTGCSDCAFQTYCGADPVFNHATQGDMYGRRSSSDFCHRNMEVIKHLFNLIAQGDRETMRICWAWVQNSSIEDLRKVVPA